MRCLVGHTGFVGSNLKRQMAFDRCFNSKNIQDLRNADVDFLVWSGTKAEKWKANQSPQEDLEHIQSQIEILRSVKARKVVLISTVDVYQSLQGVDENTNSDLSLLHPYGRHRLMLEHFFRSHFASVHILRLPALFGWGIKKNAVYDLLHRHRIEFINPESVFQFYFLDWLGQDLDMVLKHNLPIVNLVAEPTKIGLIAQACFNLCLDGERSLGEISKMPLARYDIRSIFATRRKRIDYFYSEAEVLSAMKKFVADFKNGQQS